jgi:nucleoside-diphosphate-sugar epimerase
VAGFLVTGSTGFVGAHVVRALAAGGVPVVAADRAEPAEPVRELWSGLPVSFRRLDVREPAAVFAAAAPDVVVHAAAVTNADQSTLDGVNVGGTAAVLAAAAGARVVYVSSASVYQPGTPVQREDGPVRADPAGYPASKLAAEALARAAGAVIGRVAACFGPLERDTGARNVMSLPFAAARAALAGRPVRADPATADRAVDLTWVGDIAAGLAALATAESLPHTVYNIGSGRVVTVRELAAAVTAAADPPRPGAEPLVLGWPDGLRTGHLAVDRLRTLPVPDPLPLTESLPAYLAWLRDHRY